MLFGRGASRPRRHTWRSAAPHPDNVTGAHCLTKGRPAGVTANHPMRVAMSHHRYVTDLVAPASLTRDEAGLTRPRGGARIASIGTASPPYGPYGKACVPCFGPDVGLQVRDRKLAVATPTFSSRSRDRCSRLALRRRGRSPGPCASTTARPGSATSSNQPAQVAAIGLATRRRRHRVSLPARPALLAGSTGR